MYCSLDPLLNRRGGCQFLYGHCVLAGIGHCAQTFSSEGFDKHINYKLLKIRTEKATSIKQFKSLFHFKEK